MSRHNYSAMKRIQGSPQKKLIGMLILFVFIPLFILWYWVFFLNHKPGFDTIAILACIGLLAVFAYWKFRLKPMRAAKSKETEFDEGLDGGFEEDAGEGAEENGKEGSFEGDSGAAGETEEGEPLQESEAEKEPGEEPPESEGAFESEGPSESEEPGFEGPEENEAGNGSGEERPEGQGELDGESGGGPSAFEKAEDQRIETELRQFLKKLKEQKKPEN